MQILRLSTVCRLTITLLTIWLTSGPLQAGVILTSMLSFSDTNGANPSAELLQAADGNFYGATAAGGTNGMGTIYRITTNGAFTTLFSFNGANGASPLGGLASGLDGLLYGTASAGGANGYGVVFKISTNGSFTPILSFNNTNGARPHAGLLLGKDGSLYGTTANGGPNSAGTAFRMLPNGTLTNLAAFDTNGSTPYGGLLQGSNGNFYGTTFQGGTNGNGTAFQLSTNGAIAQSHLLNGANDGANSYASLIQATDGNLYGTAFYGGTYGYGTVFKMTPAGGFSTLISFGGTNGAYPQAALLQGADGNLYGTTQNGGAYTNQFGTGYGTVFRLTAQGALTTLVSFRGTNGAFPRAGLVKGADGNLYGTTTYGGTNDNGTVFRLSFTYPPPPVFQSVTEIGPAIQLTWSAVAGEKYQLQYLTNLAQNTWLNLGSVLTATDSLATTFDTIVANPRRFYRVVVVP